MGVAVATVVGNETCTCQRWNRVLSECSLGPCVQRLQGARGMGMITYM